MLEIVWLWLHCGWQRLRTAKIKDFGKYLTSVRRISFIWSQIIRWCFFKSSASSIDLLWRNVRFLWSSSANSAYLSSCTAHRENHQTSSAFCKLQKMIIQQVFLFLLCFVEGAFWVITQKSEMNILHNCSVRHIGRILWTTNTNPFKKYNSLRNIDGSY